ncbi:MAG: phage terminase small subunit P27 family [Alphaproteobacteria bacterium]|nr:phage terminase small subunit P27 family [Alphaproteobacteria bacterium]
MARPRKTTQEKKDAGTFREDRANAFEPTPVSGDIKPPAYLSAAEKKVFKEIYISLKELGVASTTDTFQIETLAGTLCRYRAYAKFIRKNGDTYETKTKEDSIMHRVRPELKLMNEANRQIQTMLQNLGLSPAARSRVNANPAGEDDNSAEGILNGPIRKR